MKREITKDLIRYSLISITGDTEILTINGWQDADDYDYALDLFSNYKQQVIDSMQEQSETIKNNVINSVLNELQNAKNEILNGTRYSQSNPTYADGTSVFDTVGKYSFNDDGEVLKFGLGDTKETIQKSMRTPSSVINSGDTWFYDTSSVNFKDGIVEGWSDISNNLRLK